MSGRGWWDGPLTVFDVETTGVDPMTDRIVTASIAVIRPGTDVPESERKMLLNPGVPIPDGAAAVHGITTARAEAEGTDYAEGIKEIVRLLDWRAEYGPIVVFNAPYDLTMVYAEATRLGFRKEVDDLVEIALVVDPLVIDRGLDKYRKGGRKLVDVAGYYGIRLDAAHSADADAIAAGRIAYALAARYPMIRSMTLAQLQDRQREWFLEWRDNYTAYCLRTGRRPPDPKDDWPIRHPEALELWHRVRTERTVSSGPAAPAPI